MTRARGDAPNVHKTPNLTYDLQKKGLLLSAPIGTKLWTRSELENMLDSQFVVPVCPEGDRSVRKCPDCKVKFGRDWISHVKSCIYLSWTQIRILHMKKLLKSASGNRETVLNLQFRCMHCGMPFASPQSRGTHFVQCLKKCKNLKTPTNQFSEFVATLDPSASGTLQPLHRR